MKEAINNYIGSLNWGYRVALRDKKVDYVNAYAEFIDPHKIKVSHWEARLKTAFWFLRCTCSFLYQAIAIKTSLFSHGQTTNKRGKEAFYTAARFVLATGERPRYLSIPGDKEHCITRLEHINTDSRVTLISRVLKPHL